MGQNQNILLLSDSHGHAEYIRQAVRQTCPDCLLFAGDGLRDLDAAHLPDSLRVMAVRGNCDSSWDPLSALYAEEELCTLDGVRILLIHGHTLGVKSGMERAVAHAVASKADVLVFGHTHEVYERVVCPEEVEGLSRPLLLCNPGSIGRYPHSFGTLTLRGGQVLFGTGTL